MALTAEDLAQLGEFIDGKIKSAVGEQVAAANESKPATNDEPQNQPENQPDYWVHLANGKVLESKDAASTHMVDPDSNETVAVIGRYPRVVA